MLECKDVRPLLAEYEAGTLPEEQAAQVAEHLLLCPICAAALEDLRRAGDRPVITAEAPSPAAPRSLGTQDPLAEQKAAPAEEVPAEAQAITNAQVLEAAPRKKLPRWGKVLIALGALVLVLGICVGVLWSMEVFAIRDWVKSDDGRLVAVIYEGTAEGEAGFRLRLWDREKKSWYDEVAFLDAAYHRMLWAPGGVYLAVDYENQAQKDTVAVLVMAAEGVLPINLYSKLQVQMTSTEGYLGNTPLVGAPDCSVLGWMPDGSALLLAAEGTVDTNIDPDYGIDFAGAGSSTVQPRASLQYIDATAASGVLAFDVNSYQLTVLSGFGIEPITNAETQKNWMWNQFSNYMFEERLVYLDPNMKELWYGEQALLELPRVIAENLPVNLYTYNAQNDAFAPLERALSQVSGLESANNVLLVLMHGGSLRDPVYQAYLILPFSAVAFGTAQ